MTWFIVETSLPNRSHNRLKIFLSFVTSVRLLLVVVDGCTFAEDVGGGSGGGGAGCFGVNVLRNVAPSNNSLTDGFLLENL